MSRSLRLSRQSSLSTTSVLLPCRSHCQPWNLQWILTVRPQPCGQGASAMRADVVEGPDLGRRGADDDDRVVEDVVGHVVPDARDLFFPARHLPHAWPEILRLLLGEILRRVVLDRHDRIDGEVLGCVFGHRSSLSLVDAGIGSIVSANDPNTRCARPGQTGRDPEAAFHTFLLFPPVPWTGRPLSASLSGAAHAPDHREGTSG